MRCGTRRLTETESRSCHAVASRDRARMSVARSMRARTQRRRCWRWGGERRMPALLPLHRAGYQVKLGGREEGTASERSRGGRRSTGIGPTEDGRAGE